MEGPDDERVPVPDHRHLVSHEQIYDSLVFSETCDAYMDDIPLVHRDYRACDRKQIKAVSKTKLQKAQFSSSTPAVLQMRFPGFPNPFTAEFGTLQKGKSPTIKVSHNLDTQYPSIQLDIAPDTEDGHPVTATIYADAIKEGIDNSGAPMGILSGTGDRFTQQDWIEFQKMIDADVGVRELLGGVETETPEGENVVVDVGKLWTTRVMIDYERALDNAPAATGGVKSSQLRPPEDKMKFDNSEEKEAEETEDAPVKQLPVRRRSKVRFFGISPQEVEDIWNNLLVQGSNRLEFNANAGHLTPQSQVVGLLACDLCELRIFTRVATKNLARLNDEFIPYFVGLMKTSLTFGHFWFYRKQGNPRLSLLDPKFELEDLQVPRWLVREFEVGFDQNNMPSKMEPTKWGAFGFPKVFREEDCAFMTMLALKREYAYQHKFLSSLFGGARAAASFKFTQNPNNFNQYLVDVFLADINPESEAYLRLPAVDTRVVITLNEEDKKNHRRFVGLVTDDHFHRNAQLTVFVEEYKPPNATTTTGGFGGWIQVHDDATTFSREFNAVTMASYLRKKQGVDVAALLHLREPTVFDTAVLKREFKQQQAKRGQYLQVIDGHVPKLNHKQRLAATNVIDSEDGLELIVGPPGTGKTALNQLIVEGLVQAGKKVIVVSRNKKAVNVAYNMFKDLTKLPPDQFVRFKGESGPSNDPGPFKRSARYKSYAEAKNRENDQGLTNDFWEMINSSRSALSPDENGYHAKLLTWISNVASKVDHPSKAAAAEYLDLVKRLDEANEDKRLERELRVKIRETRTMTLGKAYLRDNVRVVFVTTVASCSDVLWRWYQPSVLVCEEAAVSTIPDLAIPLAAFLPYLELVILSGDYCQQRPMMMSAGANEAEKVLKTSLFETLVKDEKREHTTLDKSYRMHSHFGNWISKEFYDGQLQCLRTSDQGLGTSVRAILQPLKKTHSWNGHQRLVVDISTRSATGYDQTVHVSSERFPNTSSIFNPAEADAVVQLVERLLTSNADESAGQKKIKPKNVLILSPYLGQVRHIRRQLIDRNIPGARPADFRVSTTAQAQGTEAEIVLVSLTRNEPENPLQIGFIKHASQLCVEMSRAKDWLFVFGNFRCWMNAFHANNDTLMKVSAFKAFKSFLNDTENKGDWVTGPHLSAVLAGQQPSGYGFQRIVDRSGQKGANKSGGPAVVGEFGREVDFLPNSGESSGGNTRGRGNRGGRGRGGNGGRGSVQKASRRG